MAHMGFAKLRNYFISRYIQNSIFMGSGPAGPRYISISNDNRAALFAGLNALRKGFPIVIAPDGNAGSDKDHISVLGKRIPVGAGAAFLAYETNCKVMWLDLHRVNSRFVPVAVAGPTRRKSENFAKFRSRFHRFYGNRLSDFLSGDPQNLNVARSWLGVFVDWQHAKT
jgi:hypothetical protein